MVEGFFLFIFFFSTIGALLAVIFDELLDSFSKPTVVLRKPSTGNSRSV